jgi:thiosulfate dehydrogenase
MFETRAWYAPAAPPVNAVMTTTLRVIASVGALVCLASCTPTTEQTPRAPAMLAGPLISSRTTMVTAWEVPRNPLTDSGLDDSRLSNEIRLGFRIFTNTRVEAGRFSPSRMSCNNCHLNGGQREKSLPLVGITGMFPEYNRRSGRLFSLNDRIVDCFLRSQNATGNPNAGEELPSLTAKEVLAVSAYLTWLSQGFEVGKNPPWRGQNAIPASKLIPIGALEPAKGEAIFKERCITCHGIDGQGVAIGDKKPGPLWGPDSWNDGAGAARVYTLAGIIRYSMPYLDPGNVTDEDAQLLAAFINSKPRPAFPFKDSDYRAEKLPVDSVYYARPIN